MYPPFGVPDRIYDLSWSPDGRTVATATGEFDKLLPDGTGFTWVWYRKAVMLWDPVTGRRRAGLPGALGQAAWSPDGQKLATGAEGWVLLWDPENARLVRKLPVGADFWHLAWSPDGKLLATPGFRESRFACYLWETATWEQRAALPATGQSYPALAWSPAGTLLAVTTDDRLVTLWDTGTGKPRRTLTLQAVPPYDSWASPRAAILAWRPDGKLLATGSPQLGLVKLWNTATGDLRGILMGSGEGTTHIQWSPDGKALACGYQDHTVVLWDPATRKRRATLRGHTGPITALAWSPNGRMLATGSEDGSLRLWDGTTGRERAAFYSLDGGKEWLVVTPAGYFAASAHGADLLQWRQGARLWPAAKFRRRFERPDLVRRALVGQPLNAEDKSRGTGNDGDILLRCE